MHRRYDHGAICGGEAISERLNWRGRITTSTGAAELSVTVDNPREIRFRWRCDDDKRDAEAAEVERLREEGKLIECAANPADANKD
jgi:hypothetical protein